MIVLLCKKNIETKNYERKLNRIKTQTVVVNVPPSEQQTQPHLYSATAVITTSSISSVT